MQSMTKKQRPSDNAPLVREAPIAQEIRRMREYPPRLEGHKTQLSRLERLAVLNGLRDGVAVSRIAEDLKCSRRTVSYVKERLYDYTLTIFDLDVIGHRANGVFQCVFCGEAKSRLTQCQRHVLAHFFAHHIAQNIDLSSVPQI